MSFQQTIQSIIDRLKGSADVKTIYGDPIETQGKTIIPVVKVVYGFGAGSGKNPKDKSEEKEGGGGGGIMIKPKGVLEITEEDTRFISSDETRNFVIALIIGFFLGIVMTRNPKRSTH